MKLPTPASIETRLQGQGPACTVFADQVCQHPTEAMPSSVHLHDTPCLAKGNDEQKQPLNPSLLVKEFSPPQHKYPRAQARLSSADFRSTLHVKLSFFPAQLPFVRKSLFLSAVSHP